jgi:hypothetical protein
MEAIRETYCPELPLPCNMHLSRNDLVKELHVIYLLTLKRFIKPGTRSSPLTLCMELD